MKSPFLEVIDEKLFVFVSKRQKYKLFEKLGMQKIEHICYILSTKAI